MDGPKNDEKQNKLYSFQMCWAFCDIQYNDS